MTMRPEDERLWGHYDFVGHGHEMANEAPPSAVLANGDYEMDQVPRAASQDLVPKMVLPERRIHSARFGDNSPATEKKPYLIPMPLIWAAGGLAVSLVGYAIYSAKRQ